jgi:hypothetical protein
MTQPTRNRLNLREIETRNRNARDIITAFSAAMPTPAEIWRYLHTALADTPRLLAEIQRQRADIAGIRLDRANLLAAIRATLAAHRDGECDPLAYLRDELDEHTTRRWDRGRRR